VTLPKNLIIAPCKNVAVVVSEIPLDEDITVLDMTTIACFYYKVNRFLIIIVSNTFDELLLHYDVCWLSFSEILTWIKKGAQHTWKA
jgi:hypothetical protein